MCVCVCERERERKMLGSILVICKALYKVCQSDKLAFWQHSPEFDEFLQEKAKM